MKNKKFLSLFLLAIAIMSCSNDDGGDKPNEVVAPKTYEFKRNGESTVSFNGQNTRILMVSEIMSAMTKFDTETTESLLKKLEHKAGDNDFTNAELNSSGKNVISKIAASKDLFSNNSALSSQIKGEFKGFIKNQGDNVFPNHENEATPGNPGQIVSGKTRYVDAKGIEMNQAFGKGSIGALMTDQALNNYMSKSVLDAGDNVKNNNNGVLESGKPYTTMEHKWDEAYGYVFGGKVKNEADPITQQSSHNSFLHKYLFRVDKNENFKGIAQELFNAFKLGRAAIVAKNYAVRDEQIKIIKEKVSLVSAVRAIHYLQSGKDKIAAGTRKAAFHDLSEGYGFLYSLQFSNNPKTNAPYLSHEEVKTALSKLTENNGLWTIETETLDSISEQIAKAFGITVAQAK